MGAVQTTNDEYIRNLVILHTGDEPTQVIAVTGQSVIHNMVPYRLFRSPVGHVLWLVISSPQAVVVYYNRESLEALLN